MLNKLLLSTLGLCSLLMAHVAAAEKHDARHQVSVSNAYIRGLPPGQSTTAAFMVLTNHSDKTVSLKKMSSSKAKKVEMHESQMSNGSMTMRKLESFSLAPKESAKLEAGGKHLMFMGLTASPKEGETVDLQLCFTDVCQHLELPVVSVLNEKNKQSHHHH